MIICLYGLDSYSRIKKQKEIIAEYKSRHSGLTVGRFDFGEDFKSFVRSGSLFGGKKLTIISNFTADITKEDILFIKSLVKDESIIVLISEDKKLGREFDFLTKKPCLSQEFDNLSIKQFARFLLKEANERNIKLNNQLISILANNFCPDGWGAVMELEKLALLDKPEVNLKSQLPNLFNMIYELKSRNLKNRLVALEFLLKNEDEAKVFNLAAYSIGQKKKFAQYDAMIKSGKLDYETALTEAVI